MAQKLLKALKPTGKPFRQDNAPLARVFKWLEQIEKEVDYGRGRPATGYVALLGGSAPADTNSVTVTGPVSGAVTYEFDSGGGVTAGNVSVTIGANNKATFDNLVVALNASQADLKATTVEGADTANTLVDISVIDAPAVEAGTGITIAKVGANVLIKDHANEVARDRVATYCQARVPAAQEVTLGKMVFDLGEDVVGLPIVHVITTATGVAVAWNGARVVAGSRVLVDNTGNTDWSANETVIVMAQVKIT